MGSYKNPIYIIGRPHSGNTMLATMLGKHPELYAYRGEGNFFEQLPALESLDGRRQKVDAIVHEIGQAAGLNLDDLTKDKVRSYILRAMQADASLTDLYTFGKSYLAQESGAQRWVQKATSYIFHVPVVAERLPRAQFLFVVRNPMDLAASKKRRGSREKWFRTLWGWRIGIRRGRDLEARMPGRFCTVRYEDLVREPETALRRVCSLCGIDYREALLDIPHVNRSETPYNQTSTEKGLDTDRVFYFVDELSASEIAALEWFVGTSLVRDIYGDLPEIKSAAVGKPSIEAVRILWSGLSHLIADQGKLLFSEPKRTWNRLRSRILE